MASPQLEDGHLRIANELVEALCRAKLSSYEFRVMWAILRKTYGYQKKTDRISLSQISKVTGLDRGNAGRTLRSLKEKNLLIMEGDQIGIQKDHEKWRRGVSPETPPVSVETLCLLRPQNSVCRDTAMVSVETPQKKEEKKKDSVKGKPSRSNGSDPRVKEFLGWFPVEYEKRFGQPYHVLFAKHGKLVKELLRTFDLPELKNRALRLWESDDLFISRTERGIGILASQINKLGPTIQPTRPQISERPPGDLRYG